MCVCLSLSLSLSLSPRWKENEAKSGREGNEVRTGEIDSKIEGKLVVLRTNLGIAEERTKHDTSEGWKDTEEKDFEKCGSEAEGSKEEDSSASGR